jgi:hypothetical protein
MEGVGEFLRACYALKNCLIFTKITDGRRENSPYLLAHSKAKMQLII